MKKILITLLTVVACHTAAMALYTTPGDGRRYSLPQLSALEGSGVTATGDNTFALAGDLTVAPADTLTLDNGSTLLLADGVTITLTHGLLAPADTARIAPADDTARPRGLLLTGDEASLVMRHVAVEQAGVQVAADDAVTRIEHCTFTAHNGAAGTAAVYYSRSGDDHLIADCRFENCRSSAVASGANTPVGLTVERCDLVNNTTDNVNRPQVNLTVGDGHTVTLRDCRVIGAGLTMPGGIGLSNLVNLPLGTAVVERCTVKDNRYGIGIVGSMDAVLKGNRLVDNHHEVNANNGGSGISVYDPYNQGSCRIEGNRITGNLWGITVIGAPAVNAGYVATAVDDPDYNPGGNVFADNGNGGTPYDLYNNGRGTVKAQGNIWGVDIQDREHIEQVVFHKSDNASLGEVLYLPSRLGAPGDMDGNGIIDVNDIARLIDLVVKGE